MKIRYLPSGDALGDLRLNQPARELRDQFGVDIDTFPVVGRENTGRVGEHIMFAVDELDDDVDVIVLQNMVAIQSAEPDVVNEARMIAPLLTEEQRGKLSFDHVSAHLSRRKIKMLLAHQERGTRIVVDLDDDYTDIPDWNAAAHVLRPWSRQMLFELLAQVDLVTVSTPSLARRYTKLNPNVRLLPNYIDYQLWGDCQPREPDGTVRIGWYGGFYHRGGDLQVLGGLLRETCDRYENVRVLIGGDSKDAAFMALDVPEDKRIYRDQRLLRDLPGMLEFDIGLIPLVDCPFNDGKSALKGMEMNAAHIPYVASPSESYRAYTAEGRNGFLAVNEHVFRSRLRRLIEGETERRLMAAQARAHVLDFTIQEHAHKWLTVYKQLADRGAVAA